MSYDRISVENDAKMEIVLKKDEKTEIQNQYQMFTPVFSCYSSQKFPLYHTILSIFNYLYFSGLKKKKNPKVQRR